MKIFLSIASLSFFLTLAMFSDIAVARIVTETASDGSITLAKYIPDETPAPKPDN
ncbi:hypothetical protein BO82DRAFT_349911 [Aspergillus uvarum CBS 121591]|uniref:Uncharacterized protein n=1 Tax=Aspergillus uvarum CBS 121591 TaxID=1448315 RepID=A0A319CRG7_9EURO|nr:hypothetical protein BO82DRAFT_349911 [Aspergillus uvarum CBS 121591]PYH86791.1 hypothetical protein BO82DRAFT_349911 [Aspergillus uvarum CBS 121591]